MSHNLDNIATLRDYLATERPATFNMSHWCNCVAGNAVRLLAKREPTYGSAEADARALLGVDGDEAHRLFADAEHVDGLYAAGEHATIDTAIYRLDALLEGRDIDR